MGLCLYTTNYFSLAAFRILSLSLTFTVLTVCLRMCLFGFILFGTLGLPGPLESLFPSTDQGGFQPLFLQVTFLPLSLPLLLQAPLYMNIFCLMLSQRSLSLSSLKFLFFFLLLCLGESYWFVFQLADSCSCLIQSPVEFLQCIFSSVIAYVWYFLIFNVSLLKFSLYSSVLLPSSVSTLLTITLNA